ncbi:MAG TPA: MlaD family protein [Myxococcota bacterium]|jgi:phospholipid/cholesterol/gamma-HCH transport system substrate-binding protein
MDERGRLSFVVGLFVLAAIGVGAFALWNLGASRGLLAERYRLTTYFEDVQGLVSGGSVRLAGKEIGTIESVAFAPPKAGRPPVRVVMQLSSEVQPLVRTDSVAGIGTVGLLGDKYVSLSIGTSAGESLRDGDEVASVSPLDLNMAVVRGTEAIDSIATLAQNLNKVVSDFDQGTGGQKLADSATGLSAIVKEIQTGDGMLHTLVYDPYQGSALADAEASLTSLRNVMAEVEKGDGILHGMIYEPVGDAGVLEDALAAAASIEKAGTRLESVLAKVDEGEGTLGLLVNDPTAYADLKAVLGGAKGNRVLQWMIQRAAESGAARASE